jgi:hypothetical protein
MSDSMEQGFNDQELADIMSEIESLEKDYEEVEPQKDLQQMVDEEIATKVEEAVEEAVVEEPVEEPAKVTAIKPHVSVPHKPVHHVPTQAPQHTSMSFNVEGEMKLNLKFWVNGQEISLAVEPNEGFVIELAGGAVFKVPLVGKKAA